MKEHSYKISGLDCPNCASHLAEHIKEDGKYEEASIDFYNEILYIKGNDISIDKIQPIIDKYEKGVSISDEEKEEEESEKKEIIIKSIRVGISLTLVLLGLFLFSEERYGLWVNLSINIVAYIIVAYDVYIEAFKSLFKGKNPFDENLLMIIASLGAFLLRIFGPEYNEFFDASLLMVLYQIGDAIEDFATDRSKAAIRKAGANRPAVAHRKQGDGFIDVLPDKLKINDVIIIKAGEIIPADGRVIDGIASVDLSSLTGEYDPKTAKNGSQVFSGTIINDGSLVVEVEKAYADSTSAKIQKLIEQSSHKKAKVDKFVDKFAKIYTPIVVGLAILIAVIPPLFLGMDDSSIWHRFIYIGLCFLVISCPCSIVISVPLAFFSGIGWSSKNGIVVKGSAYFDEINSIKYFVTDKTGTLTEGHFSIRSINPIGINEDKFLEYLKAAESRSNHPLAKAIIGNESVEQYQSKISDYQEIKGNGISLIYENKVVFAGKSSFLRQNSIEFGEIETPDTIIHLAVDGNYVGYVCLEDQIKEEAKEMISGLENEGIKTILLSGDKEGPVKKISNALSMSEYRYGLLPDEKCEVLSSYIQNGKTCFMGDGINDAASIKLANVGIAMGRGGSDLAIENADIVIINDDLSSITKLRKIAKKTRNRVIFNIIVAITIKIAFMLLSIFIPSFPLSVAVIADTGLLVLLIISSLLILRTK